MVFAFVVVLVGVLLGNNPLALGQETQAAPPSVPPLSPLSIQAPFKEREFAPYEKTKKGTASISGQGFLVTRGKEVIYQPGDEVALVPETAYTREWFDKYVQRQGSCSFGISEDDKLSKDQKECGLPQYILRMVLGDKRLSPYVRFTRANPTGHFWFNKVPPGRYFIVTRITWEIAASGQFAGGLAWAFVEVGPGEQLINIVVTD
jgi:hypothetical protein